MDRKLETAELRITELEIALANIEQTKENWRALYNQAVKKNSELSDRLSLVAGIMTQLGLVNKDQTLMLDPEDVAVVKQQIERSKHLEIFEAANRANPMVNDAWNKYLMALRLCGFDNANESND